jgi:hypothetical protein
MVPVLFGPVADQAKASLVNQGSRFQRLPLFLLIQPTCRQPAQLVVHERQQLRRRARIPGLDGANDLGDVAHGAGPIFTREYLRTSGWGANCTVDV